MYIKITDRCNMKCVHCGVAATEYGEDMTFEVFKEALKVNYYNDSNGICIGGGEPTIHPLFKEMLDYAIENKGDRPLGLVTNGSNTEIALYIVELTRRGIINSALSQDEYHDPIDKRVVDAYAELDKEAAKEFPDFNYSYFSKGKGSVINVGRGKNISGAREDCWCSDLFIVPNGDIYACGCLTESYGTVYDYTIPEILKPPEEHYIIGYCSKTGSEGFKKHYKAVIKDSKNRENTMDFITGYVFNRYSLQESIDKINTYLREMDISPDRFKKILYEGTLIKHLIEAGQEQKVMILLSEIR